MPASLQPTGTSSRSTVEDTGPGIEPRNLERIFDAFDQADATIRTGTGLGLAISRNFARLMQGDVVVESTPGSGSVFTFTFEAGTAEVDAIPHAVASRHDTDEASARSTLSQQLRSLPPALIEQLREAALEGRATRLVSLADQVGQHSEEVSAAIRALARDFEYDSLVSALQPSARDDGKVSR